MPSGTDVRIRIWCANVSDAAHTGIQKSKDGAVTAPVAVAGGGGAGGGAGAGAGGGGTTYECVVNVRGDEIDRVGVPRFRGGFVNGSKDARFIYIKNSGGRAKVMLTNNGSRPAKAVTNWITHAMVQEAAACGGYLYTGIAGPDVETGSAYLYGGGWQVVGPDEEPPVLDPVSADSAPPTNAKAKAKTKAKTKATTKSKTSGTKLDGTLLLRITCRPAPPKGSGLQHSKHRSELLQPVRASKGKPGSAKSWATYEVSVRVAGTEEGRTGVVPRLLGDHVFGNKSGRFLKLMLPATASNPTPPGVKVLLTHNGTKAAKAISSWITVDMAKQALGGGTGAALVAEVPSPLVDSCSVPLLGDGWALAKPSATRTKRSTPSASASASSSTSRSTKRQRSKR